MGVIVRLRDSCQVKDWLGTRWADLPPPVVGGGSAVGAASSGWTPRLRAPGAPAGPSRVPPAFAGHSPQLVGEQTGRTSPSALSDHAGAAPPFTSTLDRFLWRATSVPSGHRTTAPLGFLGLSNALSEVPSRQVFCCQNLVRLCQAVLRGHAHEHQSKQLEARICRADAPHRPAVLSAIDEVARAQLRKASRPRTQGAKCALHTSNRGRRDAQLCSPERERPDSNRRPPA